MSESAEDETSDRETPNHEIYPLAALTLHSANLAVNLEAKTRHLRRDVGRTDAVIWGHLLSVDEFRWPARVDLTDRGENFPASKPQGYIIGRDSECDFVIDVPYVSNRHCLIYPVASDRKVCVFLRDLSSNGTFVNETLVGYNHVVELKDRDEIAINDASRFLFGLAKPAHKNFSQKYTLLSRLGKGHTGEVFECMKKSTGERFAVKIHTHSPGSTDAQRKHGEGVEAELNLMGLCHRNIIFMKEAFSEVHAIFHVTQLAEKGELFNLIVTKSKLSEDETRHIFKQLFDAVKYLHDRNIVHRDLKPENILVLDEECNVVLCSFDLSITITAESSDDTLCGTPSYVAPEVLANTKDRKYGREVDIWSLGVILYICLCGFPPFSEELYSKDFPYTMSQQIKSGRFDYPSPYWDSVGDPALALIDNMLVVDPERRFTIEQCLTDPWLTQAAPGQELPGESALVIRRKPTMLSSGQVEPSSTYMASLKELHGLEPGRSPSDPITSTFEAEGKGKTSSPLIKQPEMKKQDYPMQHNIHGEPRSGSTNTKMIENIGNELKTLTLDKQSSGSGGTAPGISWSASVGAGTDDSYDISPTFASYDMKASYDFEPFDSGDDWSSSFPGQEPFIFKPTKPTVDQSPAIPGQKSYIFKPTTPPAEQSPAINSDNFETIGKQAQRSKMSDRELSEHESNVLELQAQIRGAMCRMSLATVMQRLWDTEECLVDLQSRIRGDWTRQVIGYRLPKDRLWKSTEASDSFSHHKSVPPITAEDPNKIAAMKRARNTLGARKSEERKEMSIEEPEKEKTEKWIKVMLSNALEKANAAVQLDDAEYFQGARSAYREACGLLHQVWLCREGDEDKKQLEVIAKPYADRAKELYDMLIGDEAGTKTLPTEIPKPAATKPQLMVRDELQEYLGSQSEAKSSAGNHADPISSLEYDPFASLVNLANYESTWPWTPSTKLPEDLQNDIEFNNSLRDLSSWTCTPSKHVSSHEIPLRVDRHAVVLPVEYKYPLTGMFSPPPDPHPLFISPSSQLSDEDVHQIFFTFPACVGFYLLINGFLQIIMPDDFDYEEGVPSLPSEFGGLKVSLIPEAVCPTAGEGSTSSPAATSTSTRTRFERIFGQSSAHSSVAGSVGHHSTTNAAGLSVGSTIRAVMPNSKSKQRFEGKIGVAVTPRDDNSKKYVTIPTHLLTDAVIASKTMSLDSDAWRKDVKVCVASNSIELGEIATIFDQDPKSFPIGFSHDVSLVDISGIPDAPRTIPYATDLAWLSQQEWMDIKYNSSNLVLLDDRSREAKSIGVVDSRCQMVGQGIFRIQQQSRKRSSFLGSLSSGSSSSRAQDPRDDPSTWTSLVARSILYRVHPDYPARGGQSGVPVCVVSESADGTAPRSVKVAGFASFVQMVSDVQKYDLEGDKLYKRLQEGRVAFYGAFQVPQELRDAYQIL